MPPIGGCLYAKPIPLRRRRIASGIVIAALVGLTTTLLAQTTPTTLRPSAYADNSYSAADQGLWVVSQPRHHVVLLFDAGGSPPRLLQAIGTQGKAAGQFLRPTGVAIAAARNTLVVSDAGNNRVQVFRLERGATGEVRRVSFAKSFGRWGKGAGEFDGPEGVALDTDGNVYVCDSGNARVEVFDAQLHFVRELEAAPGHLRLPLSIGFDGKAERLYVVDAGNLQVHVFSRAGQWLNAWGKPATPPGPGTFAYPFGLALGNDDSVYLTDSRRQNVQQFKTSGDFVREWGGPGQEPGRFFQPEGIAADSDGRLIVVDFGSHRGQTFTPSGELLDHFPIPPGDLILPTPPRPVSRGP